MRDIRKLPLQVIVFTGCSDDDDLHTGFTAKGVNGRPVSGVLCGEWNLLGWGKGSTIRLD